MSDDRLSIVDSKNCESSGALQDLVQILKDSEYFGQSKNGSAENSDFEYTLQPSDQQHIFKLAELNLLIGELYQHVKNRPELSELARQSESRFMHQRLTNLLLFEELRRLELNLCARKIDIVRIKGAALIPRFYHDPGERHLSDVDILVSKANLPATERWLSLNGYRIAPTRHFSASRNRQGWIRSHQSGLLLSIDVHTELYWSQARGLSDEVVSDSLGFLRLSDRAELLHLIVNWVEQDNCASFNKCMDLYRWVISAQNLNFSWDSWWNWVDSLGHGQSARIADYALKLTFNVSLPGQRRPSKWLDDILAQTLNLEFLFDPRAQRTRYFVLRHLTRPALKALEYDVRWLLGQAGWKVRDKLALSRL